VRWASEDGIQIEPHGIDFSEGLVELARARLPNFAGNLAVANAYSWQAQRVFDYVHTLLEYVPDSLRQEYLERLPRQVVEGGGRLIVSSYSSRRQGKTAFNVVDYLNSLGFRVDGDALSYDEDGWVLTRTAWILKKLD
jgi:trans-aconitate methyltransferase